MSPLEQLIMKKMQAGPQMDPMEQKAKMANLDALKSEMHGMMKDHLQPQAKVEVAASSPEGLKAGLDQAQDVVEKAPMGEDEEHEAAESPEQEKDEHKLDIEPMDDDVSVEAEDNQDLSPEEIAMLKKLLMKAGKI